MQQVRRENRRAGMFVEATPLPIVVAVAERLGFAVTPVGPRTFRVVAPHACAPRLIAALVSAGATVYRVTPDSAAARPHRRAHHRQRLGARVAPSGGIPTPAPVPRQGIMAGFTEVVLGKGLVRRFSTIRWKLTGAFLAVSLLLALTMILIFIAGVLYILNSPLIPESIGKSAHDLAGFVGEELARPDSDPDQLIVTLRRLAGTAPAPAEDARPPEESIQFQIGDDPQQEEMLIALLDREGKVITTTHALSFAPGAELAAMEPAPASELISLALSGHTVLDDLSAWSRPDHQPLAAAAIRSPSGEVIGALYMRIVNFPSLGLFLSNLAPFLASFLIPWITVSAGLGMIYAWFVGRGFATRIARLTEASVDLADGNLERRVDDPSGDELGQLGRQFNTMADQLAESLRSLRLLADRNAQLAEQAAALAAVEERNRLARDLHDSVSQELFSLTMLAAAARRSLETRPDLAEARLVEIGASARRALEETRSLIFALRPAALDGRGLAPALRDLAAALAERQGLKVDLSIEGERHLPLDYEQALFRIIQEALANVARHSGVRSADVALQYQDDAVALKVHDAGRGFDLSAPRSPRAIGLQSMAERAEALGGTFELRSRPDAGTTISVRIPVLRESDVQLRETADRL